MKKTMNLLIVLLCCALSVIFNSSLLEWAMLILISIGMVAYGVLRYYKDVEVEGNKEVKESIGSFILAFSLSAISLILTYNNIFNHLFEIFMICYVTYNFVKLQIINRNNIKDYFSS